MQQLKLAAAQYAIELWETWDAYEAQLRTQVATAVAAGAQLLLLPEYAGMALTAQLPPAIRGDLQASIHGMQALIPRWYRLCEQLAQQHRIWFCPGSLPVRDGDGQYRNRCWLFGPEGELGYQDKLIMTRFEREQWLIAPGAGLKVFALPFARLGILICYDNEFPLLARQLAEAEVDLILAPSCTDTRAGYHRVRIGCQARALENQLAVLQSPTVGRAGWSPAVDENVGRAGLFVPPDYGLPADGVIAESEQESPERTHWLHCTLDLAELRKVRQHGQVLTRRDWPEQFDGRAALRD